jgi:hypothetical protein
MVSVFVLLFSLNVWSVERIDIDKTNMSEANNYYLIFISRGESMVGHAFVAWGKEDWAQQQSVIQAFGFYPKDGKGVLSYVPGKIVDDLVSGSLHQATKLISVKVNSDVFNSAKQKISQWETQDYNVMKKNCIDFVIDVATSAGVKVPSRGSLELPEDYLERLIDANR